MSLYAFDRDCAKQHNCRLVGIDEAGRGPLAGPVTAAAVILDLDNPIEGIDDSKKLTAKKREELYELIIDKALAWGVASASPTEIDSMNILQATFLAMKRALKQISEEWSLALVDGNQPIRGFSRSKTQAPIIDGDATSASIAAASIIAKVTRDRFMIESHKKYPLYYFHQHKGYATALHRSLVKQHGMCKLHRKSFCYSMLAQTELEI
ncbi:MAG: ribonuclease HII [Chitinivibrionales bacterium]